MLNEETRARQKAESEVKSLKDQVGFIARNRSDSNDSYKLKGEGDPFDRMALNGLTSNTLQLLKFNYSVHILLKISKESGFAH